MAGAVGVPVGQDVERDGATPNAECTPERCAIVLASAYFEQSDALSPPYCFLFVVPDLPHHTDAPRCNFFFNLPFQCCLGRLCGARMPGCCCCFAVRPGDYAPLPGSSWCVSRRLNSSSPVACKDVQAQHRRNVPPPSHFLVYFICKFVP